MTRRGYAVAALVGVLAVAGSIAAIAIGSSRAARPSVSAAATLVPASSAPATTASTSAPRRPGPVVFAFGGDVHFEGGLRAQLNANPAGVLSPIAPLLQPADVAMVNLETAITDRGTPASKQFTFRAPATAFAALAAAGVDVVTEANNHGMDYGPVGLSDSIAAARFTRFPVVGIGNDANEAYRPFRTTVRGTRVGVIGATQVLDDNLVTAWTATDTHAGLASAKDVARLVQAVRDVRPTVDTLVVYVHWGEEQHTCPTPAQESLAHALVAAGADIVVGSHAHRLVGAGRLGAGFVDYGLGNFVFYTAGGPGTESGVLYVTATGRHIDGYRFAPAQLRNGVAHPLDGAAASAALARWDGLRSCTDLTP